MAKNFLLNLLFPKFCFNCQREGVYLCEDCKAILDINNHHQVFSGKNLNDLYWAIDYKKPLIKKLIHNFKYEPFAKELSKPLSSLIINHFQLIEKPSPFFGRGSEFFLIPVPLYEKRLRWRGFNQAQELAKQLSLFWNIPLLNNLIKIKKTFLQSQLAKQERLGNVRNAFLVKNQEKIKNKKILLIDDVFTTGATMEECAWILKKAGAQQVIGLVIARD